MASRPRSAPTSRSCSTSARRSTSPASTPRARRSAPTAGWSAACAGTREHGPAGQVVYGIVQGGVEHDLRMVSAGAVAASGCDGVAIGGSLGQDKAQMYEVVSLDDGRARAARARPAPPPARDRRRRRSDRRRRARGSTRSTARCRPGSAATASRSCPTRARAGASISPRADGASRPSRSSTAAPARRARPGSRAPTSTTCMRARELTGAAARDASQPRFIAATDGRPAGRDRRRAPARGGGGAPGRRGAGHVRRLRPTISVRMGNPAPTSGRLRGAGYFVYLLMIF